MRIWERVLDEVLVCQRAREVLVGFKEPQGCQLAQTKGSAELI